MGDYGKAIIDYTLALKTEPGTARAYEDRAAAWLRIGRNARAKQDREKAAELTAKH